LMLVLVHFFSLIHFICQNNFLQHWSSQNLNWVVKKFHFYWVF
jgi:hypothetical protein